MYIHSIIIISISYCYNCIYMIFVQYLYETLLKYVYSYKDVLMLNYICQLNLPINFNFDANLANGKKREGGTLER